MSTRPLVELPSNNVFSIWCRALLSNLHNLDKANLATVRMVDDLPSCIQLNVPKREQSVIIRVNGKLVLIDVWDYSHPGITWLKGGGNDIDIKLILKIQYNPLFAFNNNRSIPIKPWTMFHFGGQRWQERQPEFRNRFLNRPKKHNIGFSGRAWGWRRKWIQKLSEIPHSYSNLYKRTPPGNMDNYTDRFLTWKSLLCIIGKRDRCTDGKNRREVEAASIGMPLFMNYKPAYLNPFKPDKHYIYINDPNNLPDLVDDLLNDNEKYEALSNNLIKWWLDNASIFGVCKTFIQANKEVGII